MFKYAVSIVTFAVALRLANAGIDWALDKGAEALARASQKPAGNGAAGPQSANA